MADERHEIEIDVTGDAEEKISRLGDESQKTSKSVGKLNVSMEAFRNVALAVVAVVARGISTFAQQQAATGRLETAFKRAGASAQELAKAQEAVNASQNAGYTTTLEGTGAMRELISASQDAEQSIRDYALAVDIASQENISAKDAAKLLARARKGEFEELKNLTGINKEFSEFLTKSTDATVAAEIAVARLREEYNGAAKANAGFEEGLKSITTEADNAAGAIGKATLALADMGTEFLGLGDLKEFLEDITVSFNDFGDSITNAKNNLKDAAVGFGNLVLGGPRRDESEAARRQAFEELKRGNISGALGGSFDSLVLQGRSNTVSPPSGGGGGSPDDFATYGPNPADGGSGGGGGGGGGGGSRRSEGGMVITEADIQAFERAQAIDAKRLEIAREEDELRRAKLEAELRILEIKNQQLEAGKQQTEIAIAEVESAREIKQIEQERTDKFIEEQNAQLDAVLEKNAMIEAQERKTAEEQQAYLEQLTAAREQQNAAAIQGIAGAAKAATGFIENERARAAIRGAMEAAEAIAAGASGNIPGAIAHGAAAAQFFAVAGSGGSASSGSGAGATSAARGRRIGSEAGAQRAGQVGGQPTNTTVQYVFNSGFAPSPRDARRVANETERARRNGSAGEVR